MMQFASDDLIIDIRSTRTDEIVEKETRSIVDATSNFKFFPFLYSHVSLRFFCKTNF